MQREEVEWTTSQKVLKIKKKCIMLNSKRKNSFFNFRFAFFVVVVIVSLFFSAFLPMHVTIAINITTKPLLYLNKHYFINNSIDPKS